MFPEHGAIDDLATGKLPDFLSGKTVAGRWSSYAPLPQVVNSHTVVGDAPEPIDGFAFEISGLWQYALTPCGFTRGNVFGFGAANDRIVSLQSQFGGLSGAMTTPIGVVDHFTVRNSSETVNRIKLLLDQPVGSGEFTSQ